MGKRLVEKFALAAVLVASLLPAGVTAGGSDGAAPFYRWDTEVPGEPGVLLRQEPLEAALVLENANQGVRILYSSESFSGDAVAVSGAVFLPHGQPLGDGWPVVA